MNGFQNSKLKVLLVDKLLGNDTIDLSATPAYIFEVAAGDVADRFVLAFGVKSTTGIDTDKFADVKVYGDVKLIRVHTGSILATDIEVCDVLGRVVTHTADISTSDLVLPVEQSGIYLVNIRTEFGNIQRKVLVK